MAGAVYESQVDIEGEGHRVFYGSAKPLLSSDAGGVPFNVGDVIKNISPLAGGALGWRCISAGSPGTWETIGTDIILETLILTNAQVKATNSAPPAVIPAQGAGNLIEVISMVLENINGGTAYANGGALALYYG